VAPSKKAEIVAAKVLLDVVPRAMRAIRSELRAHAGQDLTVPQFRVLVHVARRSRSNSELADLQGVSRSAMSRMIDALVEKGLAIREASEADSRSVNIRQTEAGRTAYEEMRLMAQRRFAQLLTQVTEQDREALLEGLHVLERVIDLYDGQG
jgi:DNA-binding MarR family transcriptional regulator